MSRQQRRAKARAARKSSALAIGALLTAGSASAATFTVSNLNDSGSGSLRDAVSQANSAAGADTIVFQSGLTGTITLTSGEILVTDSVSINGPGAGVITVSGNNASRVFHVENSGATAPITVDINNLTLTAGLASGASGGAVAGVGENLTLDHLSITSSNADAEGGGVYFSGVNGATLTISNSTITGNNSGGSGGGIANEYITAGISVTNTTITNNHVGEGRGGGMYAAQVNAPVTVSASTITGNQAIDGGGFAAYGIYGKVSVTGTTISSNTGYGDGGGVFAGYCYSSVYLGQDTINGNTTRNVGGGVAMWFYGNGTGSFAMTGTIVSNNTAGEFEDTPGAGGGVWIDGENESCTIADSIISGNVADPNDASPTPLAGTTNYDIGYGGGAFFYFVNVTVQRTTISGNTATQGGGVLVDGSPTTFENTTIVQNSAKSPVNGAPVDGGGVIVTGEAIVAVNETTVTNNSATTGAGGISTIQGTTATLYDSILANNTPVDVTSGGTVNATYTLIKTPGGATIGGGTGDITGSDPNLGALADNSSTVLAGNPATGQQHPQTELPLCPSPVINAGDPAFTPPPSTDERGLPRVAGGRIDMGAAEVQGSTIAFTTAAQSVNETAGTVTVTVARTGSADAAASVSYATANGSATAGTDYTTTSGTLTWAAGDTANKTFTVPILNDGVYDPNETFTVNLTSPTCVATLGSPATQTITILETPPTLSINNVSQNEGNSGTTPFTFTVSLSKVSTLTTTVNFATADGTATTSASGPGNPDYSAVSGTVTFNPGETSKPITVNVNGDTTAEPNETFTVNLSSPTNAAIATGTGTGTIVNDDAAPTVSINNVTQAEGNSGTTPFTFTVSLSAASAQTVTVNFATANGTATAGSDYTAANGTLTFTPGTTSQSVTVNVTGDTTCEPDETFTVNLSGATNATIGTASGTGTITNDDPCTADLAITKTAGAGSTLMSQNVTYTITVMNNGPATASGVTVTDPIQAGATFVSATPSQGTCSGTTTVTCSLGTLANGATASIALTVQPTGPGTLSNTATVSSAQVDSNTANNSATAAVIVAPSPNVPTLDAWAKILLAMMTALIGLFTIKPKS